MTRSAHRAPSARTASIALFPDASEKERRILGAALELFVTSGFHGTSIPAIAKRAGVAAGTIYLYFASKEELVNALLARLKGDLARRLVEAVPARGSPREQFEAIWEVFARYTLEHERAVAFCELHHHASYVHPGTLAAWQPGLELLDAHFTAGREAGVYRDLAPAALRALVVGILFGLHKFARAGTLQLSAELLAQARESAWAAVARPDRPENPCV